MQTWARERLWLGMTNVGFWVVASAAFLWARPDGGPIVGGWWAELGVWSTFVLGIVLVQAPFDWLGGVVLPRRHDRMRGSTARWVRRWLLGVVPFVATWVLTGGGLLIALAVGGRAAGVALVAAGMVGLLLAQRVLAAWTLGPTEAAAGPLAELAREARLDLSRVEVHDAPEPSFVGGWTGPPGAERLVVPRRWATLPRAIAGAQLIRRAEAVRRGWRSQGLWLAFGFNLFGSGLALASIPVYQLETAFGLLYAMASFTLWSFVGLLVLPTLSRRGVYALDAAALERGVSVATMEDALRRLDPLQEDEPRRAALVETVFHPVPARDARIEALTSPAPRVAPWRVARNALFLGWACLGLLSRTVHCNVGLPGLWVHYPGD